MKKGSLISRMRNAAMSALVCFMLAIGGVMTPSTPAMAAQTTLAIDLLPPNLLKTVEDMEGFREVLDMLASIISIATQILNVITDGFNALFGAMDDAIKAQLSAKLVAAQIEQDMINYTINSDMNDKEMATQSTVIMEHTPPRNAHLCRQALMKQGAAKGGDLVHQVGHMAADAYLSSMRGVGKDGSGPQGIMVANELRCMNKYGNPIDGYPPSCFDATTRVGEFKRTFIDADLLASTMDGAVTLEIPNMEQVSYKDAAGQSLVAVVAVPQNNEQKMFLAAMNYCLQMAGPKPTPPAGSFASSPKGLDLTREFRSAVAASTALVAKCGEIIGYYARPNALMEDAIYDGNKMCRSAIGKAGSTNYLDEETLRIKFDGCNWGLSKYQRDYLDKLSCKSAQYYMLSAHSGALTREMMDQAVACGAAWNGWQENTITLQGALVDVARQHLANRKRFDEIDAQVRGAQR